MRRDWPIAALLLGAASVAALVAHAAEAPAPAPVVAPGAAGTPPMTAGPAPDPASIPTSLLPEGPNRDLVIRHCGLCHPMDLVVQQRRTQDQWDTLISRMVDHGVRANEDEQQKIFEYLVLHFGLPEPNPAPATP